MTDAELRACLSALDAAEKAAQVLRDVLGCSGHLPMLIGQPESPDPFVKLPTAARIWDITPGAARKRLEIIKRTHPDWVTKRGAGRLWVHREALQ